MNYINIEDFKDKILKIAEKGEYEEGDCILFITVENEKFRMFHEQDCCESVYIESINGDLSNLIGTPVLLAEEVTNNEKDEENDISSTWTFYKIGTIKGTVTIRWCGTSNGYYSERVDIITIPE